jgi:hypothetical protein
MIAGAATVSAGRRGTRDAAATDLLQPARLANCGDIATNDGLRAALTRLDAGPSASHTEVWRLLGDRLLAIAGRDARWCWRDRDEYIGAYLLAGVEAVMTRRERLLRTATPWALLVTICRHAAAGATAAEAGGGLTGRDPVTHRTKTCARPAVVSLDVLCDAGGFDLDRSPWDTP